MTEKKHINPEHFSGKLTEEEIKHLAECPRCRLLFTEYIEAEELHPAPVHLKTSVLEKIREPDVAIIAGSNRLSRRLQLFYFSLRVGAAVLCSLSLLFLAPPLNADIRPGKYMEEKKTSRYEELSDRWHNQYKRIESFTGQLNELFLPEKEVSRYDKKEK